MLITTAFASCTHESEDLNNFSGNHLKVSFNVAEVQSRAIFTEASLPTASVVGAKLDGYDSYSAITFTANGTGQVQTWTPSTDVVLGEDEGTLYTYFPYSQNTGISAIPVDMTEADQTDWLYGTPVTGVSEDKADVTVTLNHALANINLTLAKGSYVGTGNVTDISVKSDGIAPKGTFNAAQATPGYSDYEEEGTAIERAVTTTLGGTATDIMVVPTGQSAAITFNVTVDGTVYTATSSAVQLEMGSSYKYTLTLNSTMMGVSEATVTQWNPITKDNLTLEKAPPVEGTIDLKTASNGVYAVTQNGLGVLPENADESCIAVAFISSNQKVMIAKADATDGTNTTLYWGKNLYEQDVPNLVNLENENAAKADYNGKANTAAIIAGYAALGKEMDNRDMCKVLETYNEGGYTDWYVPAAGQLYEFRSNKTIINEALTAINGTKFNMSGYFWSSSERAAYGGWYVCFSNVNVINTDNKSRSWYVRFVRDI